VNKEQGHYLHCTQSSLKRKKSNAMKDAPAATNVHWVYRRMWKRDECVEVGEVRIVHEEGRHLTWKKSKGKNPDVELSMVGQYGKVTHVSKNGESCTIDFNDHCDSRRVSKSPGVRTLNGKDLNCTYVLELGQYLAYTRPKQPKLKAVHAAGAIVSPRQRKIPKSIVGQDVGSAQRGGCGGSGGGNSENRGLNTILNEPDPAIERANLDKMKIVRKQVCGRLLFTSFKQHTRHI